MKRSYQITGVLLVLLSALVARESVELWLYTEMGPGPGFFPFLVSMLLALLGAIMVYRATFLPSDPMPEDFFPSRAGYLRVAAIILAVVGTVVLMNQLGFRLTMLLFLLFLLFALGRQNPIVTAIVAVAGSFGVYHVFVEWLMVALPKGFLGI